MSLSTKSLLQINISFILIILTTSTVFSNLRTDPTNLRISEINQDRIVLEWDDNADDETAYIIERLMDRGWLEIGRTSPNTTTYEDRPLNCYTEYKYRVRLFAAPNHYSGYSNEAQAQTLECDPPPVPTELQVKLMDDKAIVTWVDNATDESWHEVERSLYINNGWTRKARVKASQTEFIDSNVLCDQIYFYRVRAYRKKTPHYASRYTDPVQINVPCAATGAVITHQNQAKQRQFQPGETIEYLVELYNRQPSDLTVTVVWKVFDPTYQLLNGFPATWSYRLLAKKWHYASMPSRLPLWTPSGIYKIEVEISGDKEPPFTGYFYINVNPPAQKAVRCVNGSVLLKWGRAWYARGGYEIQVSKGRNFAAKNIIYQDRVKGRKSRELLVNGLTEGKYFWRVRGLSKVSLSPTLIERWPSSWSPKQRFRCKATQSPPTRVSEFRD